MHGIDVERDRGRDGKAGARHDRHGGQAGQRGVPRRGGVVVERDVVDLVPLVGTHDHEVVPVRQVGDELQLRHHDMEPPEAVGQPSHDLDALLEGRLFCRRLGEWTSGDHEIDPIEAVVLAGRLGHGEVSDRRWVERAWERPAPHNDTSTGSGTTSAWLHHNAIVAPAQAVAATAIEALNPPVS